MKKTVSLLRVVLLLFVLLAGCAGGGERTLVVANWKGYGSDSEYAVEQFEKANNCKVVHQYYDSLEQMLTMIRQGGNGKIDVVLSNMAYTDTAKKEGLISAIDTSKLENYASLQESLKEVEDVVDEEGKVYGVPWMWGTTALGYNKEAVGKEIDSWSALWDEANQGKVTMFDDHITAVLVAAMYIGEEDPYNADLSKIEEALMALKKNCKLYWTSYDSFAKPYSAGEITMGPLWSGAATQLNATGVDVEYVYPKEGVVAWTDYWCMVEGTKNEDLAMKWIDWMSSEDFQKEYSSDLEGQPPVPANVKVQETLSDDVRKALYIDGDMPEKLYFQKAIPEETNQAWLDLWNKVKAAQ